MLVRTDTTVTGKYISVIMVRTLIAAASLVFFSVSLRIVVFSCRASSASSFSELPLPKSRRLDS